MLESLFWWSCRPQAATLSKKRLWHRCFPVNFTKFLRTIFFTEHLWWLLQIRVTNKILKCLFFSDESLDKQKTQKLLTFISVIHEKTKINWYHHIFGYQRLIFFSQPFHCPNTKFVLGGGGERGRASSLNGCPRNFDTGVTESLTWRFEL